MRQPGYDLARALALLGMVLVNFRGKLEATDDGRGVLGWFADHLEGKPAALFVVLVGAGLSLAAGRADDFVAAQRLRATILQRAAVLVALGVVLAPMWEADVLHFHGVYLLLALPLLHARRVVLWLSSLAVLWIAMMLQYELDWAVPSEVSVTGALRHLGFSGLYPVFPWIAFVLIGMAVGRAELGDRRTRGRVLAVALVIVVASTVLDALGRWDRATGGLGLGDHSAWLRSWPRAPRPMFVVQGSAIAVAVICGCISALERVGTTRIAHALVAAGRLSLTLYVAHVLAMLVLLACGVPRGLPLAQVYGCALAFFAAALGFAGWWRRRHARGPLEALVHRRATTA